MMTDAPTAARTPARLLRMREVQQVLSVSRGTVYKLIEVGKLKPVKIGRAVRFREDDIATIAS